MLVTVDDVTARPVGVVGGWLSPGGGGGQAAVAIVADVCDERLPAASNASTTIWCEVPHVRLPAVYDVAAVVPESVPSTNTRYPVTPTLSVEAVHPAVMLVAVPAVSWRLVGAVGGLVSAHALVVTISEAAGETFPAAS
jgi:hypothetical protein